MIRSTASQGTKRMAHNLDDLSQRWRDRKIDTEPDPDLLDSILSLDGTEFRQFALSLTPKSAVELELQISDVIRSIDSQLGQAFNNISEQTDGDWVRRAVYARSMWKRRRHFINQNRGKLKKPNGMSAEDYKRNRQFFVANRFVDLCRDRIDEALFGDLMSQAVVDWKIEAGELEK